MAVNVLIVDDAIFMRSMLKDILVRHGFKVVGEAENGKEACEKYKELHPDITTMDIVMPQMNGIEAVKEIIKFDSNAKVVMCSALGQEALVTESIEAGAKDFIVKPFSPDKVVKIVTQVVDATE
jgi:two-component system, chemotaxis family, chemotaxis protein CheY